MQGRVREGGDHLAALRNHCKGHTSFCRAGVLYRRNRLEGIVLRTRDLLEDVQSYFPLFPVLTSAKVQGHQAVLRFCTRVRAYRERRPAGPKRSGPPAHMENYLDNM
jgi:hypothetical protein